MPTPTLPGAPSAAPTIDLRAELRLALAERDHLRDRALRLEHNLVLYEADRPLLLKQIEDLKVRIAEFENTASAAEPTTEEHS